MGDDIDSFILDQKKKLNQERNKLDNSNTNGYKENIPPKGGQEETGGGLLGGLGSYDEKRRRLQEERKKEYNQLLAEKQSRGTGRVDNKPQDLPSLAPPEQNTQNNGRIRERHSAEGRRRAVFSDDEDDAYRNRPPPRKGWATPTYEEILDKKRREERAYRRYDDPDSYPDQGGKLDDGYLRPAKSEGHINRYDDNDDRYIRDSDRDYQPSRRVRFQDDRRDFSRGHSREPTWPAVGSDRDRPRRRRDDDDELREMITQLKLKFGPELIDEVTQNLRANEEPGYGRRRASSPPRRQASPPPRRQSSPPAGTSQAQPRRQTQSNTPRAMAQPASENFSASLFVGKEPRVSADVKRKEEYRKELERQIEEVKQSKKRAKEEDRILGPGAATIDVNIRKPEPSSRKLSPPRRAAEPAAPPMRQQQPVQAQQPPGPSSMRDFGNGYGLSRPMGGILDNGWGNGLYGAPMMQPYSSPPATYGSPGLGQPYMSPLDEAYYFYANRNPLDPNPGTGMNGPSAGMMAGPRVPEPPPPRNQPEMRIDTNMDVSSPRTQGQRQFNRNTARGGGGFGSEVDEDRNKSRVEQQKQYQDELRRQMEEQKQKKKKMKEDDERYNRKIEEEIKNYDPYGKGGGGAPMRDEMGNIVANRKTGQAQGTNAESDRKKIKDITSPTTTPRALPPDPGIPEPLGESFNNGAPDQNGGNHARGGNGIFGEPKTNQQKSQQQIYQEELRRQIEEKKKRQEDEKKVRDEEEKRMMQKIQEDQEKIKQQMEDERRKEREKAEAAQRQQEELQRQQEEKKKEEHRKIKDEEGKHLDELRQKQDEERRQREQERAVRIQSPAIPTLRNKDERKTDSPPVPTLRNQDNRIDSPVVPAARRQSDASLQSRADSGKGSRVPSADVLRQLAKMRQQLRSEKERVETDLTREKVKPSVYDPRLQHRNSKNDLDIFEVARNKEPVSFRRGRDTSHTSTDNLEFKQRLQLKKQEEELAQMKKKSPYEKALPGTDPKDLGIYRPPSAISANMLESESAFIDVPNGAASRSETRISRASPRPGPDPMKVGSMVSMASLDPDAINVRNEARLKKLKALSGDDISTGDPDDILEKFMASQKHKRPPSGLTLQDDTWLHAG